MVPTPADIARYRHIAAAVVRGVGLLLLLYSVTRVSMHLWQNFEVMTRQFQAGASIRRYVGGMALPAVLLWFAVVAVACPRWVARWLVPARVKPVCPGCGFSLSGLRSGVCPECGLRLGVEFFETGGKAEAAKSE